MSGALRHFLPGPFITTPSCPRPQNLGNDALKAGLRHKKKFYLRQAIEQYGKGLEVQCSDAALNSILCSNRAHVNLLLGNLRNAYQDGLAALRHNDKNIKVGGFDGLEYVQQGKGCVPGSRDQPAWWPPRLSCLCMPAALTHPVWACRLSTVLPRGRWGCASTTAA